MQIAVHQNINPLARFMSNLNNTTNQYSLHINGKALQQAGTINNQHIRGACFIFRRIKQILNAFVMAILLLQPATVTLHTTLPVYTSLIVAAGLLGSQEVRAQNELAPLKNINLFISQDDTEQAKIYNSAKTYAQRDSIREARIKEDWTDTGPWANCNESVLQLLVNSHNWNKDINYSGRPIYNGYNGLDINLINENNGTIADMGKLGLPIHSIDFYDPVTLKEGHGQNYIVLGDTLAYENIKVTEPTNDVSYTLGDGTSPLPKTIEEIQLFYTYTYKDEKGKENYWKIKVLGYKSEDGKITETYNINNDTRLLYPWIAQKPLNQLVHLQMSRNEIPTATNAERKLENKVKIYPNPASNYINIETTVNEPVRVDMEIYDITGRLVENYHSNEYGAFKEQLDISKLATGTYIFKLETETINKEKYQETKNIIKQYSN